MEREQEERERMEQNRAEELLQEQKRQAEMEVREVPLTHTSTLKKDSPREEPGTFTKGSLDEQRTMQMAA